MHAKERDEIIRKLFEEDMKLLQAKGHDYSGLEDCLDNLKDFGFMGVVVRIGDKFNRLKNFIKQGELQVSNESVIDTLRDIRNYAFLGQILFEMEK